MTIFRLLTVVLLSAALLSGSATSAAFLQGQPQVESLHRPLDQILDLYVRDGMVYYRHRRETGPVYRYAASNVALVMYVAGMVQGRSRRRSGSMPTTRSSSRRSSTSIRSRGAARPSRRSASGKSRAFDRLKHRAAGRSVTLDEIEKTILPEFKDPRLYFLPSAEAPSAADACGAGSVQRRPSREATRRSARGVRRRAADAEDRPRRRHRLSHPTEPREADRRRLRQGRLRPLRSGPPSNGPSSPRILPKVLPLERELLEKNEFRVVFHDFDWRLNDLTGGRVN